MCDEMLEKFTDVASLQWDLNDSTNGECWINDITKEGLPIDWILCILMETAETIDSFNWKHWKNINTPADINNVKVEMTDKWHFFNAYYLRKNASLFNTKQEAINATAVYLFSRAYNAEVKAILKDVNYYKETSSSEVVLKALAIKMIKCGGRIEDLLNVFYAIMIVLTDLEDFGYIDLYKLYISKNSLNSVRQMNGYKEGTYLKEWDGVEDNVVMTGMVADMPTEEITYDNLVKILDDYYKTNIA